LSQLSLLLSISSTFYECLFCMKVSSLLRVWLWTNLCTKNARVKLWWNWHLPTIAEKMTLDLKVVIIDSKILLISLCQSKSVTQLICISISKNMTVTLIWEKLLRILCWWHSKAIRKTNFILYFYYIPHCRSS